MISYVGTYMKERKYQGHMKNEIDKTPQILNQCPLFSLKAIYFC